MDQLFKGTGNVFLFGLLIILKIKESKLKKVNLVTTRLQLFTLNVFT